MIYIDLIWKYRLAFLFSLMVWGLFGSVVFLFATPKYEAEAKFVILSGQLGMPSTGGVGEGLGAIGGLIGFDLGMQGDDRATRLETVRSRTLALQFVKENGLLAHLYAERWDSDQGSWRKTDSEDPPTEQEIVELFRRKVRDLSYDPRTSVGSLKIRWKDPELAAAWAIEFLRLADRSIRQTDREENSEIIAHLISEIKEQPHPQIQGSLAKILETYLRQNALIEARREYAVKVIDQPISSMKPYWPNPLLIVVSVIILATVSGFGWMLLRILVNDLRRRNKAG